MTTLLEIIPSVCVNDLSLALVKKSLSKHHKILFSDVLTGGGLDEDSKLTSYAYNISIDESSYYLRKSFQDFDIDPAIDYLKEEHYEGLDINEIALAWEMVGFSYELSPNNSLDDEDNNFIELVVAIGKAVSGVIFITSNYYKWCKPGLYSISQFYVKYIERKSNI